MKNYLILIVIILTGLLVACNTDTPSATRASNSAQSPSATKGEVAKGKNKFSASCASCHGNEGKGITGLAPSLQNSAFSKSLTDEQLLAFIKKGREQNDPANKTKIAMPAKGGDPSLTDAELTDIVAYLRTLEK